MTPKPPSPSDGSSLPPRHRPALGNLAKDTTETDLWAFDDLEVSEEAPVQEPPKPSRSGIPTPRDFGDSAGQAAKAPDSTAPLGPRQEATGSESVTVNISKKSRDFKGGRALTGAPSSSSHSRHGSDFDELDKWEEVEPVDAAPKTMAEIPAQRPIEPAESVSFPKPVEIEPMPSPEPVAADDLDEFSPKVRENPAPVSIRPQMNLTKIESIGLVSLLVLMLIGGGIFYFNTISRLPTEIRRAEAGDFPIKGIKTTVLSAVTFWRVPITSGGKVDTVRRDALLIPVVELAVSGGGSAIRIFFRNSDGQLVGDAVSHFIQGDIKSQFAATDGFNDLGMHAAYRTRQSKPWTIEVLEAPSEDSPAADYKKLFEMDISSDRR